MQMYYIGIFETAKNTYQFGIGFKIFYRTYFPLNRFPLNKLYILTRKNCFNILSVSKFLTFTMNYNMVIIF